MFKSIIQAITYSIFKVIFSFYFYVCQHVRFKRNGFKIPKGPIVFISNHHSNWDGLYMNVMFPSRIIHFVAHDELFKNKFLRFFSGTVLGEIKRGATHQDITPIREMMKYLKRGKSIGIYPEGDIHMFGRTLPIENSIAKLVKKFKCPVVILSLTGAHLRATRVAKYPYHSHITYSVNDVILPNELEAMEIDNLHERIVNGITVDEMKWQRTARVKQYGKKRAEWMELGLFMCPKCHKLETLKSKNCTVYCKECDFEAKLDHYSFFHANCDMPFDCTSLWDDWQLSELRKICFDKQDDEIILKVEDIDVAYTKLGEFFKKPFDRADLVLYNDRITYQTKKDSVVHTIYLKDMDRAFLQYKDVLEIIVDEDRLRFYTKRWKWSAYLWTKAVEYLLEKAQMTTKV